MNLRKIGHTLGLSRSVGLERRLTCTRFRLMSVMNFSVSCPVSAIYDPPPDFRDVVLPEDEKKRRLQFYQKVPVFPAGVKPPKMPKRLDYMRGPEPVHTFLLHKQFGVQGQGKRMGGGKGNIHHYTTPVKAGRIIFELAGKMEFPEVESFLREIAGKLPFPARVVSHDMLEKEARVNKWEEQNNQNPYTFEYIIRNNMLGCHSWISPYDLLWFGKYR
ncbi:unnamed protein product [Darwinula stevensoni]|uniref:Large ribosomal subunit protein uL16m n=1 Tax=Darwinula stevensoni TaxID=69355 RepID=A0A7R8X3N5_9CRUS|nr:unnamed protein product [Darwinula stevensoni]CAG0884556.1 unnamed protein product [Darwinula stevensoni]